MSSIDWLLWSSDLARGCFAAPLRLNGRGASSKGGSPQDIEHELALRQRVRFDVSSMPRGQFALERFVGVPGVLMGAKVVAEDDLLLVLLVRELVHVDLVRAAAAVVALAAERCVGPPAEVDAAGDAELAEALVCEFHQGGDAVERVDERSEVDGDVDDRLGRNARNRRAADVLDVGRPLANRRLKAGAFLLEELRPARAVIGEVDSVGEGLGHGRMIARLVVSYQWSAELPVSVRRGSVVYQTNGTIRH